MTPYIYIGLNSIDKASFINRSKNIIIDIVSKYLNISIDDIKSKNRKSEVTEARNICAFLLKNYTELTLSNIGKELGNRDHSTIINCIKKSKDLIETDNLFAEKVNNCIKILNKKL